jgi:hypothetical protein
MMKNAQDNINEWLLREAHIVAGHAFQMEESACLLVCAESGVDKQEETPVGFLISHKNELIFKDARTPEGKQMLRVWSKHQELEMHDHEALLPAEYWYG